MDAHRPDATTAQRSDSMASNETSRTPRPGRSRPPNLADSTTGLALLEYCPIPTQRSQAAVRKIVVKTRDFGYLRPIVNVTLPQCDNMSVNE